MNPNFLWAVAAILIPGLFDDRLLPRRVQETWNQAQRDAQGSHR